MKTHGRVRSGIAVMVVVMLIAACGGGGNEEGSDTTQAVVTTTTPTTPTTQPDGSGGNGGGLGSVSRACLEAAQAFANAFGSYGTALTGMTKEQARQIADQLRDSVAAVPSDLHDDYEDFVDMLAVFYLGIAEIGIQPGVPPSASQMEQFGDLAKDLEDAGWEDAAERVGGWFEDNCN